MRSFGQIVAYGWALVKEKEVVVCREVMEQGREAKDPAPEEVWEAAVEGAEEVVSAQARAGIVFVRTVERRLRIRQVCPATISVAQNVE